MTSALIGHTGFVGGNLLRQRTFDARFNSSNIEEIAGQEFDLVVCSGAPAEKWKANREPERDRENIDRLMSALGATKTKKMILISSVDVFISPVDVNEDSPTPTAGLHPYGLNRLRLEQFLANRFDTHVVRLAGLYGPGIKKNVIYDFLNDNDVHKIDSRGIFQFYNLDRLWNDLTLAMNAKLPLVHLPCEPVSVADVAREAFGIEFTNEVVDMPARYDIRTKHAEVFGGRNPYIENRTEELSGIARFVARERER